MKPNEGVSEDELNVIRDDVTEILNNMPELTASKSAYSYKAKDQNGDSVLVQYKGDHFRVTCNGKTINVAALSRLKIDKIEGYLRWRVTVTPEELKDYITSKNMPTVNIPTEESVVE
jgi:hypothetical protein